jgi:hypothetical protein
MLALDTAGQLSEVILRAEVLVVGIADRHVALGQSSIEHRASEPYQSYQPGSRR